MIRSKGLRRVLLSVAILLCVIVVSMPVATVIVYESIFGSRYETLSWLEYSVDEFDGLESEKSDFYSSDGVLLSGYKYCKAGEKKGVVIISHGLGGGGHNGYMPFIDYFASMGYYVFGYDAHGNDESGGDSSEGLPQGIIDLNCAIDHVAKQNEYQDLPIMLFGHSFGGYSVANVLNFHPEVAAAVIIAGFDRSENMIEYQSKQYVGFFADLSLPLVYLYEEIKFGKEYTGLTGVEGMKNSNARIMIVHSEDDTTVPPEYGYYQFYSEFSENERFDFVLYEDKGHDYLFYSDDAEKYRDKLNEDYRKYVLDHGGEYNSEIKEEFMEKYLDKKKCFEPDPILMERIIKMFDNCMVDENGK